MVAATSFVRCCSVFGGGSSSSFLLSYNRCPRLSHLLPSRISPEQPTNRKNNVSLAAVAVASIPSFPTLYHRYDNSVRRRRRAMQECFFCTAASSDAAAEPATTSVIDHSGTAEDELVKIKEAANTLDIRVGKIIKAWRHEEADSLYVEEVDVGEPEPRIICSGLVKYVPLHQLQGINVVVLANLKPRNMRGVKSYGMLMAASDASHENVELLVPPEGSLPGQRIWFGNTEEIENLPDAASPNQIQKKKIWELVQPHLRTDDSCIATLGMYTMRTPVGVVVSGSLRNARIS
ncbi:hypothetical protein M9H77_19888 [Catharanthus roseus]|uniref:Uncharacterized protein n=1 Tax=Catharanthus roseus TaxID=4058 RepID=A0ACC0BBL7_CATRO|nr:hypothetical protein M9H77_19888 [Catharanthus roseus]